MARTKKTVLDEIELPEPTQEEFDLDDFLTEIGPGTSVVDIFRVKLDGSRPRVARVTLDVLREDVYGYLAETFGTGKYDLQFKGTDRKIKAFKRLAVESPGTIPNNGISTHPVGSNGNGGNSFERELLLSMIAAQKPVDIGGLLQGLAAMRPVVPPSPDPVALFTALITGMATLKGNQTDDGMERLQKMMSLVKDMLPEGRHEENLYTVAKDVGTKLIEAIKPARPSGAREVQSIATGVQEAPKPAILPVPEPSPQSSEETLQQWIKAQLTYLKSKARMAKDPAAWVDYIFENDDEPGCNAILIAMERGVTFDMLCQFDSEIASNPQLNDWFRRLYDGLRAELHAPMDTAGSGGNGADPSAHAPVSPSTIDPGATTSAPVGKPRKRQPSH